MYRSIYTRRIHTRSETHLLFISHRLTRVLPNQHQHKSHLLHSPLTAAKTGPSPLPSPFSKTLKIPLPLPLPPLFLAIASSSAFLAAPSLIPTCSAALPLTRLSRIRLSSSSSASLTSSSRIQASFFSFLLFSSVSSSNCPRFARSDSQYALPPSMARMVKPWA
jgi:hypothetical protein